MNMVQGVCVKNDALIMRMTAEGKTAKEIASAIGAAEDSVKHYRRVHGYKKPKKETGYKKKKTELDGDAIILLIGQRMTYSEIAKEVGCSEYRVKYYCRKNGILSESKKLSEERKDNILADLLSGMSVKETAKKHNVSVPMVYKCADGIQNVREPHICPSCGRITTRLVWCSDECARKETIKRDHARRRARIRGSMVDRDITLTAVVERDNGICHLCGKQVNEEDYIIRHGAFICGNWYPSIDHVIPLSKGGKHSWDNVRLAHRICNSVKGDDTHGCENVEKENNKADERLRCI